MNKEALLPSTDASTDNLQHIIEQYKLSRNLSEQICQDLLIEDYSLQAIEETSPLKWHLAHTSWFYETFILKTYQDNYVAFHPEYEYLFNSYYNAVGEQFPRAQRGLLSRPSVDQVYDYRKAVDQAIIDLLNHDNFKSESPKGIELLNLIELGINHEQQHQELMLTDLKYNWSINPLYPVYKTPKQTITQTPAKLEFLSVDEGLYEIGVSDSSTFHFDNEGPRHKAYLHAYSMANRLVSNGEYLEFIEDGGYQRSELWLSEGWSHISNEQHRQPLYWHNIEGQWYEYTLHGLQALDLNQPVCHINAFEADAFARWKDARLPTEFEWEVFAQQYLANIEAPKEALHPEFSSNPLESLIGQVWQWTSSDYKPYPGFKAEEGAIGEYNGKFMVNQLVLRGASCFTSHSQLRLSYRNFFHAQDQWQLTGIVLAR